VIADYTGTVTDPAALAVWLAETPGVVEHGLFPPHMVATVIVARGDHIEHREISAPQS
jgi:ribose 5-phosphate isomerase A